MPHAYLYLQTTFPQHAAEKIIQYLTGSFSDPCEVIDNCVGIASYGSYLLAESLCPHAGQKTARALSTQEKIDLLRPLTQVPAGATPAAVAAIGINWNAIVLLVLQILQELIDATS